MIPNLRRAIQRVIISSLLCCGIMCAGQLPFNKSYALVIGIDRYKSKNWPTLRYARRDAEAIADLLGRQGFTEIITLYDEQATKTAILSAMQDNLARKLSSQDRVLVFFGGHGYTEVLGGEDRGYLIPFDAISSSQSYISLDELRFQASYMNNARQMLFLIDACYGGLLTVRANLVVSSTLPDYLAQVTTRYAKQVLSAGGKGQQVVDNGPNGHSVFVGAILEAVRDGLADYNGDGYVTFAELANYVEPRATNAYQTPSAGTLPGHQGGEFIFLAKNSLSTVSMAASPKPPREPPLRGEGNRTNNAAVDVGVPAVSTQTEVSPSPRGPDNQPPPASGVRPAQPSTFEDLLRSMGATKVGRSNGSASISGQLTDPSMAVIPGANVAILDARAGTAMIGGESDEHGNFRINCPLGTYYLIIYARGFLPAKIGPLTIQSSSGMHFDGRLQVGSTSEVVEVKVR
jgi:uncharacterized caspase-like protein